MSNDYLDLTVPEEGSLTGALLALAVLGVIVAVGLSLRGTLPRFAVIQTTSMVPTLVPGDVVMITHVNPNDIHIGDIIAFNLVAYDIDSQGRPVDVRRTVIVVHRVIGKKVINGHLYFRTKGDNNPTPDPWYVLPQGVLGKAEKVASLGSFGLVLTNPVGRIFVIVMMLSSLVLLLSTVRSYSKGIREDLESYM
ncbi:hypothetical protein CF15_07040 [Pyrodictium occultum]|uniref:Peptidase S26 domain-containing protein n=1 Tax=Pyrodictium occultum TaxID=2309 RepID=A0A0V8RWM9_PYROC|nr:signal peptidase I [Pyrodictium occultum]KSW12470.1 hypothetical protein CF15_07040 [Pyrodictium occultum]